jgi:hypothetical protein
MENRCNKNISKKIKFNVFSFIIKYTIKKKSKTFYVKGILPICR